MATVDAILEDARKVRFLNWLTTPPQEREPRSQRLLAEELGCSDRLLRVWKSDPGFRALWDKQAKDIVGDPEQVQMVLMKLRDHALDDTSPKQMKAAELYLRSVEAIKPPQADLASKKAAELSDAELDALLQEAAQREKQMREASV